MAISIDRMIFSSILAAISLVLASCGGDDSTPPIVITPAPAPSSTPAPQPSPTPVLSVQERQCEAANWRLIELPVAGLNRRLLWGAPTTGAWTKGAIVIMHGGGGHHYQFCVANDPIIDPQVRFAEMARQQGFAVFTLESTDKVTDRDGRLCGKVWDDEIRDRPNLDLPFLDELINTVLPSLRKPSDRTGVFLTGLSSGGYMTTRAATHLGSRITAFAAVSSGDPFGWHRICDPALSNRTTVFGAGFDNETGKQIIEPNSCFSATYPNEKEWTIAPGAKPVFRLFHDENDGVNDISCGRKVDTQLRLHGYTGEPPFLLIGDRRDVAHHFWQDGYNQPLLDFFHQPQLR